MCVCFNHHYVASGFLLTRTLGYYLQELQKLRVYHYIRSTKHSIKGHSQKYHEKFSEPPK